MTDGPAFEVIDNRADGASEGRFEVHLGDAVAFAEYRLLESGVMFPHTVVPPAFEGKGVGGALVRHGMAFARERGQKVIPVCTFFAGYIAKHPEFHDLVHPDYRKALGI
ncbi:MAG: N-acetyltransferase [Caulobacter sp.]|nr:N-acetyltransferase [Caulobacter sp.]